jgi:hypothetical protein
MKLINSVRRASRRATRTLKRSAKKASNTVRRSFKYVSKSMKRSGKKASNTVRRSVRKTKRATRKTVRGLAKSVGSLGKRNYSKKSKRSSKKSKRSVKHGGAIRLPGEYFGNDSGRYGSSAAGTSTSGCATHNDLKISNPGTVMNGGGRGCSSCKF